MSRSEWEAGTLRIPSAEWARVKKALAEAARAHHLHLYEDAQIFWKLIPTRARNNSDLYERWVQAFIHGNDPKERWRYYDAIPAMPPRYREADENLPYVYDLEHTLTKVLRHPVVEERVLPNGVKVTNTNYLKNKPRRVKQIDLAFPTNKTVAYDCGEGSIRLDNKARTIHWSTDDGNHSVEAAHNHPIARALFKILGTVRWTRGSGGDIVGNDEYNQDDRHAGGGGNSVTASYGPKSKGLGW